MPLAVNNVHFSNHVINFFFIKSQSLFYNAPWVNSLLYWYKRINVVNMGIRCSVGTCMETVSNPNPV